MMLDSVMVRELSGTVPMTFKLRLKTLFAFVQGLRRNRPNVRQFNSAVREVIAQRMSLTFAGKMSAIEARRMVVEKQLAILHAQLAYTESILSGAGKSAVAAYFEVYWRAVESNRKRLSAISCVGKCGTLFDRETIRS
jgi:hypothetical protein